MKKRMENVYRYTIFKGNRTKQIIDAYMHCKTVPLRKEMVKVPNAFKNSVIMLLGDDENV